MHNILNIVLQYCAVEIEIVTENVIVLSNYIQYYDQVPKS